MDTRREALAAGRRAPGTSLLPAAMGVQRVPSALSRGGVAHMCSKAAGDKAAKEKAAEEEAGAEGEEATKDQKKEEVPPEEEPEPPLEVRGEGVDFSFMYILETICESNLHASLRMLYPAADRVRSRAGLPRRPRYRAGVAVLHLRRADAEPHECQLPIWRGLRRGQGQPRCTYTHVGSVDEGMTLIDRA